MTGDAPCFLIFQMRQGLYLRNNANEPNLFARLAESPARFDLTPARIGVRLLAIFDRNDFLRAVQTFDQTQPPRRN